MKKIFLTFIILTIVLSISLAFVACKDTSNDKDEEVTYMITVNCEDRLVLDTISVKLFDTNGNAVTGAGYLDSSHRATFKLAPSVYKVVLIGPLSAYEDIPETLVTPTSLNANITLTKKGSDVNVGNKVTYTVTLQMPTGEIVSGKTVQLCTSADAGGACVLGQTDENGVATFELAPNSYEIHIMENQYPDGYTFDNTEYTVSATQRDITVQFKAIRE